MSSTYGEILKLSIFGQSHGPAIGLSLDGIPAGMPVDLDKLQQFLNRRAPGNGSYATPRKEADNPEFLSGIIDNYTCGSPISAVIRNTNTRSGDYENLRNCPRPGHADYPAQMKHRGFQDVSGGGHFSGRLTAPLCIAGGLCKQWLEKKNIYIGAHIFSIGSIKDEPDTVNTLNPDLSVFQSDFPVINPSAAAKMQEAIAKVKTDGDSIGGTIECVIKGIPAGLGDPMFDGIENKLAQIIYGIPAVKGLEFGSGFAGCAMHGSENNDSYIYEEGRVKTTTNNCGGILGGITTGMPIIFKVGIKPTPSITKQQQTINLDTLQSEALFVHGRHDPCIVPRAVPVVEAAAAIAIFDICLKDGYI